MKFASTVRGWSIANLIANIVIVLTGVTVRLTDSGLGCPTWPRCTDASYLPHGALGIHGAIEFGNRLLTFVLTVVAIVTALAVFAQRDDLKPRGDLKRLGILMGIGVPVMAVGMVAMVGSKYHPAAVFTVCAIFIALVIISVLITRAPLALDPISRRHEQMRRLALLVALGIPAQAVIGGVTVMSQLNPWVVGIHFLLSMGLIVIATQLVHYCANTPRTVVPQALGRLTRITAAVLALVLWLGTVVTGSGPHSGDQDARRTGLDPALMSHFHAGSVYLLLALSIVVIVVARRTQSAATQRAAVALLVAEGIQAAIGLTQFWTGLPIVLVAAHALGAALLTSAMTSLVWSAPTQPAVSST